jgi:hypothetical protein
MAPTTSIFSGARWSTTNRSGLEGDDDMAMTGMHVTRPEPVELIPGEEVDHLIAEIDLRLASLEREAANANTIADDAARRAGREGVDEQTSTWAIVRLQRFLDGLREEAEHDARTVVTAARKGASARVEEARAGATLDRHVPDDSASAVSAVPVPVLEPTPAPVAVAPARAVGPVVIETPADASAIPAVVEPAPVPEADASVQWAIRVPEPPSSNGEGTSPRRLTDIPVAQPAPVLAPAAPAWAPTAAAPVVTVAPAPVASPAPAPAPAASRKRRLRGFPLSAVLEVLAVLLVLLFILLRLS